MAVVAVINRGLTAFADVVFVPLTRLPPLLGLVVAAGATAVGALVVVRAAGNPTRIRSAKNGMYAALLEMRLFNDDLPAVLRAQGDVLRYNGRYLAASLVPVLWLVLPFALLFAQLDAFYAYRGLPLDAPTILTARLDERAALAGVTLEAPAGLRVTTPAVIFPATHEVAWTIVGDAVGEYKVTIRAGAESVAKTVAVSDDVGRHSGVRPAPNLADVVAYPSEPPLSADGPVTRVTVAYPARELSLFGWQMPWYVPYGIFTILGAFLAARLLRVEL